MLDLLKKNRILLVTESNAGHFWLRRRFFPCHEVRSRDGRVI